MRVPQLKVACCTDGNAKFIRHANAGTAQANIMPDTNSYLGLTAQQVIEDRKNGRLTTKQAQHQARVDTFEQAQLPQQQDLPPVCDSHLSCNREVGSSRSAKDMYGLVVLSCIHSFPGRGLAVPMVTNECHYYYDLLFEVLLRSKREVKQVYFDLGCQYFRSFLALTTRLSSSPDQGGPEDPLPESVRSIRMMVPWMHAMDHKLSCQLKYSAMYQDDAAWRIGEQQEWQWSELNPVAALTQFMTAARWWDTINLAFELHTEVLQLRLPEQLRDRLQRAPGRVADCRAELNKVVANARAEGVTDLEQAMAALRAIEEIQPAAASMTPEEIEHAKKVKVGADCLPAAPGPRKAPGVGSS